VVGFLKDNIYYRLFFQIIKFPLPSYCSASIILYMNQSIHLFRLQKVDSQIDQINNRIKEINQIISTDKTVSAAENVLNNSAIELDKAKKALQKIEDEVQSLRIKVEMSEASLYSGNIKSPKELKDLQGEIAAIKRHISTLEDRQLEAMVTFEQVENIHKGNITSLEKTRADFTNIKAGLMGELSQRKNNKDHLTSEHEAIITSISQDNLDIYNRLRTQKRGLAVTTTVDGACTGCGSELRPAELQEARNPQHLAYCSSCGRILYAGS
jgi:uncharacterized protein